MSGEDDSDREKIADTFDQETDPLAKLEEGFEKTDADPFDVFRTEVLSEKEESMSDATLEAYDRTIRFWREFMDQEDRHPACPNKTHIKRFVAYLRDERENAAGTIQNRLMYLNNVYEYWQTDSAFPHPTTYNPIDSARDTLDFDDDDKPMPRLSVDEVRDHVADITHIRDRAIVLMQLKLGLRVTELCNIKFSEMHIANQDVLEHYDEMGSAPRLTYENAVYIPADRPGNKSEVPRILPLDDELRAALVRYLLIRPDNGEPWVFLTQTQRGQMQKQDINPIWKDAFQPEYAETEYHRGITSHFGRHFFTNFWRFEQGLEPELVKYMRGDKLEDAFEEADSMSDYLHPQYEDIEDTYRENVFKLNL